MFSGKRPRVARSNAFDVVHPLAGEAPLAVEVLVDVGDGRGVGIDAGLARLDGGEERAIRAGERDADPRLEDAVAAHDPAERRVVLGAVERVGERADQVAGRRRAEARCRRRG